MLLSQLVGIALLIPFFGWAIFLLRRRFQYIEENSLALEVLTAGALAVFFWIEATVLDYSLENQKLLYLFAMLGLSVSTFALYAHVLISLASRIVVDMVSPRGETAAYQPRFGPVDALERQEDYEGALQEYLVLARIYPRNFEVLSRTGRAQEILGDFEEAVTWYLRARKRASGADEALIAINHLCNLYDTKLDQPEQADQVLAQFLQDYPNSLDRDIVVERLERRAHREGFTLSSLLEALEENPLALAPVEELALVAARPAIELVTLETAGVVEAPPVVPAPETRPKRPSGIGLERLDQPAEAPTGSNGHGNSPHSGAEGTHKTASPLRPILDPLEPPQAPQPEPPVVLQNKPRITLESMEP